MPERNETHPLPQWMIPAAADQTRTDRPPERSDRRQRSRARGVVRRALNAFADLLAGVLSGDAAAARPGLLQGIDPRFKVFALVGLIVIATLVHTFSALLGLYGACVLLAVASRVSWRRFSGVWLVVPLFSAFIMLPAVLNVVTQGNPVWTIWRFHSQRFGPWRLPEVLAVTDSGLIVAARLVLRSAVCVTLAVLLTSTTRPARLFRGLRALGVPQIFVALLSMMERYLGVIARTAQQIHLAKLSRSIQPGPLRREQAWVAAGMGSLFRRTYALSQAVYLAMLSRGYTGEVHLLEEPPSRPRDWAFLAAAVGLAAGLLVIG